MLLIQRKLPAALRQGGAKRRIDFGRGIVPQPLGHVAIDIERHRDRGMAKAFLRDLGMDTRQQQLRGMSMPERVEMYREAKALREPAKIVGEHTRRNWRSIRLSTYEAVAGLAYTEREQFLGLIPLEPPQLLDREGGQRDRARLAALGRLEPHSAACP